MCACYGFGLLVDSMRSALAWRPKRTNDSGVSHVDALPLDMIEENAGYAKATVPF